MTSHPARSFLSSFPAASEADWRARVDAALKGAPFEKKLIAHSYDGLAIPALSQRRAGAQAVLPARGLAPWGIAARLDHPDASIANALALEELEGGADTLVLSVAGSPFARGLGLPALGPAVLDAALKGVHADLITLRLEPGQAEDAIALGLWLKAKGYAPAALKVAFNLDSSLPGDVLAKTIRMLAGLGFSGPFIAIDGRKAHEAGASEAQGLGLMLAEMVASLRALVAEGFSMAEARAAFGITLAFDQDQAFGIGQARAARRLITRLDEALGLAAQATHLHGETAWRMLTKRDAHGNILRTTIAAFAAGIGGVDSLAVLPFTAALGLADGAARRLARNTSLILMLESGLADVLDPACGAGTLEEITDQLCHEAWRIFQSIEAQQEGALKGHPAALANGVIAAMIEKTRIARARAINTRRAEITGTSAFPALEGADISVLLPARPVPQSGPLASYRLAEPYEVLRDKAEAMANPPSVFLANLGRIAEFNARASFAKGVFEAGGIKTIGNDGFYEEGGTNLVALTEAFKASGARLACLCSSDALYLEEAQDALLALIASGAEAVFMAGKPGANEAVLHASGLAGHLHAGMDVPAFLVALLERHIG